MCIDEPASCASVAIRARANVSQCVMLLLASERTGSVFEKEPQRRSLPERPVYGIKNVPVFCRDPGKIRGNSVSARLSVYPGLQIFINMQYYCIKRHKYAQIHTFIHGFCINGRQLKTAEFAVKIRHYAQKHCNSYSEILPKNRSSPHSY